MRSGWVAFVVCLFIAGCTVGPASTPDAGPTVDVSAACSSYCTLVLRWCTTVARDTCESDCRCRAARRPPCAQAIGRYAACAATAPVLDCASGNVLVVCADELAARDACEAANAETGSCTPDAGTAPDAPTMCGVLGARCCPGPVCAEGLQCRMEDSTCRVRRPVFSSCHDDDACEFSSYCTASPANPGHRLCTTTCDLTCSGFLFSGAVCGEGMGPRGMGVCYAPCRRDGTGQPCPAGTTCRTINDAFHFATSACVPTS